MKRYIDMVLDDKQNILNEMEEAMAPFKKRIQDADDALTAMGHKQDETLDSEEEEDEAPAEDETLVAASNGKPSVFSGEVAH